MVRPRFSRAQWQELLAEQAHSGLTVAAFCLSREVPVQSFYVWPLKLNRPARNPASQCSFVPVTVTGLGRIEVELPCGAIIRVASDDWSIRHVIDALLRNSGAR